MMIVNNKERRNVCITQDTHGNKLAVIQDVIFRNKQNIDWDEVKKYLERYVGDIYVIDEDKESIFIGKDLPDEYTGSQYTARLKGGLAKTKANAAQAIPELIEISENPTYKNNFEEKHKKDAAFGWYRYDVRFAMAVYNRKGEIERYNIFRGRMIIRYAENGKKYLYDIINIKKESEYPAQTYAIR